jgi:hypothetical protein
MIKCISNDMTNELNLIFSLPLSYQKVTRCEMFACLWFKEPFMHIKGNDDGFRVKFF